jgi:hypothetical protein
VVQPGIKIGLISSTFSEVPDIAAVMSLTNEQMRTNLCQNANEICRKVIATEILRLMGAALEESDTVSGVQEDVSKANHTSIWP